MLLGANVFRARRRDDGGACRADCALFSSQGTRDQHSRSARWRWRWPSSRLTSADSCSKPASAGCCVSKSSAAEALSLREAMRDGRPAADVGAFLQNRQPGRSHPSLPVRRTPARSSKTKLRSFGYPALSGRSASSLPQLTQIFFHENLADFVTPAPAERLHHPL
jgi:hypothetical protein